MSGSLPLRFLGVGNVLDREYRNSPAYQWARELLRNGIEANAQNIYFGPEWECVGAGGPYRLQYADDGVGMTRDQLRDYMWTLGKGSKVVGGPHDNYALGCRMTLLPWNPAGVVVISVVDGQANMVKMMLDPSGNDGNGEYVLAEESWVEQDGAEGRSVVYPPYMDEAFNWADTVPDFIWAAGHGTTFILLGQNEDDDTIDGDPQRGESVRFLTRKYFNLRFWELPAGVTLRCIEFYNPDDRSTWPKQRSDKGYQNRTVKGTRSLVEHVKQSGEATVESSGTVPLPDGTVAHWWLKTEGGYDTGGLGSSSGFIATMYRGELYGHAYANIDDGDTRVGAAVYRQFGIGREPVRKRLFVVLEPPEFDEVTGQQGVAPSTGRADLYWIGPGLSPRSVKPSDWSDQFADRMPQQVLDALVAEHEDADSEDERQQRLKRVMDRFSRRWRAEKARAVDDKPAADTHTRPTTPGSAPREPIDTPTRTPRVRRPKKRVVVRGRAGAKTLGTPDQGETPAKTTRVSMGYPQCEWVTEEDINDDGMIAAWQPPNKAYPSGLIELDEGHGVIRAQIDHWKAQYPAAYAVDVEKIVKNAYEEVAIAKVSHMHALAGTVLSEEQRDNMLQNPALTTSLLGFISEDALISPRLGGLGAKKKKPAEEDSAA